jgi:hypothetical protein
VETQSVDSTEKSAKELTPYAFIHGRPMQFIHFNDSVYAALIRGNYPAKSIKGTNVVAVIVMW